VRLFIAYKNRLKFMNNSNRPFYFLLFFLCHELIIAAYYFEIYLGLEPCPLCMVSRAVVITLGISFLLAAIHNPKKLTRKIYHVFFSLFALLGVLVSGRHIYLQSLPPEDVPSCGPGLDYMLETLPMSDVLKQVLHGSGECAEVSWQFMSLSMPVWMLIIYLSLMTLSLVTLFKRDRNLIFSDS
jgi:disulfide bond formation protein DsbB